MTEFLFEFLIDLVKKYGRVITFDTITDEFWLFWIGLSLWAIILLGGLLVYRQR